MNEDILIDQLLDILQNILQSGVQLDERLMQEVTQVLQGVLQDRQSRGQEGQPELSPGAPPVEATIPVGGDLLWILAGAQPEAFVSYLETMPDPALNALARNPNQLRSVIERLQSQVTLPAGESSDGIPHSDLQSSNIYGFQYDPKSQTLRVKFQGSGAQGAGPVYQYQGVPAQIFKMFQAGAVPAKTDGQNKWGMWYKGKMPSQGAAFHELIKLGGYPYQKTR